MPTDITDTAPEEAEHKTRGLFIRMTEREYRDLDNLAHRHRVYKAEIVRRAVAAAVKADL